MESVSHHNRYYGGNSGNSLRMTNLDFNSHASGKNKKVSFGPYIVGPTLGEGEFGKVKLGWSKGKCEKNARNVAIKLVRRDAISKNPEKEIKLFREINALKQLRHPNIVRLEDVLKNSKYIGIVLQYAPGGELYKYMQRKRRLKDEVACRLFSQLISGVHYMHRHGLAHRDLKLENLLLDEHENLLISDFGFVNELRKGGLMDTSCGSPCYAAPELVLTTKPYEARKADVWSCGMILYAMLAGYLPWDDDPDNPEGNDIAKLYNYITKTALKFPEYIKPMPRDLLRRVLVLIPEARLTVIQIKKHMWLQPHAQFLSYLPDEWDTKKKAELNNKFRVSSDLNPRCPNSASSTSSVNSRSGKRNSLIIDSTLFSQPVPPQESPSHAYTKPRSPSSDIRKFFPIEVHTRCNSAASIILKAVVDVDRQFFPDSKSTNSLEEDAVSQQLSPDNTSSLPAGLNIPRSVTYNKNVSMSLIDQENIIIKISPQNYSHTDTLYITDVVAEKLSVNDNIPLSNIKKTLIKNNRTSSLPRSTSRPRPTSYQPILRQNFNDSTDSSLFKFPNDLYHASTKLRSSLEPNQKVYSTDISEKNALEQKTCVIQEQKTLIEGEDVILIALNDCNYKETVDIKNIKRSSQIVGSAHIETKIDPPVSKNLMPLQNPSSTGLDISPKDKTTFDNLKDKRFSLISFYSFHKNSNTSIENNTEKEQIIHIKKRNGFVQNIYKKLPTNKPRKDVKIVEHVESDINTTKQHTPDLTSVRDPNSKEPITGTKQRFSMFTPRNKCITNNYVKFKKSTDRNSLIILPSVQQQKEIQHSPYYFQQEQPPTDVEQREQSTARKVFDFFKRRSLKL